MSKYIPNVIKYRNELIMSVGQTVIMLVVAGGISFMMGLVIGVCLVVTKEDGILPQKMVNRILNVLVNIFRSIPFVILITLLLPLTRILMGTPLGVRGSIFPLIIGTIPFFSRQVESALSELDGGLIEAALAMGCSPWRIIISVYLKESIPALVRGCMITLISLLGLTAMVGAIAGGGIGSFVLQYGHGLRMSDITYTAVLIILLIVSIIQMLGNFIIRKTSH